MAKTLTHEKPTTTQGAPPAKPKLHIGFYQDVVAYGSPSEAGEGGRLAVEEHADALRRLRDS